MVEYIIQPGDTLYSIASRFGVPMESILSANSKLSAKGFISGGRIVIPIDSYRDTVYNILGFTSKLTEIQMRNIAAGRRRIVELAKGNPGEMYINGPTAEKMVSLTFDDGPDGSVTPRVLDILKANKVKANFFFIGAQAGYFPGVVKRAFSEGHLVLNHSFSHPHFTQMDEQEIKKQITLNEDRIKDIVGVMPAIMRPPYGETDERVLGAAKSTDNKIVIWSTDTMDWVKGVEKQAVVKNVLNNVRPGEIILMHSGPGQKISAEALPEIIGGLRARGFGIVDLGVMLGVNPYK